MNNKNKKLFLLFTLFLFFPLITLAGTKDMGEVCSGPGDCITNLCATSTLTGADNKFCVCATPTDCENKYKKDPAAEVWTCETGVDKTKGLPFCNSDKRGPQEPIAGAAATPPPPEEAAAAATGDQIELTVPKPEIKIPGLPEWTPKKVTPGQTTQITYIADYIVAIYKYGLIIGSILAVMMIMIGGIIYLTAAGAEGLISTGKNLIYGAVSGTILLLGSFLLLKTINPNIVNLTSIGVETVPNNIEQFFIEHGTVGPELVGSPAPYTGPTPPGGIPGNWKQIMTSIETCGAKNGYSLPMEERKNRLAQIINIWAQQASIQGGAIYIHGGPWNCAYSNAANIFLIRQMTNMIRQGKSSQFSPGFLSSTCGQLAQEFATKMNGNYENDSAVIGQKEYTKTVKGEKIKVPATGIFANAALLSKANSCTDGSGAGWKKEYDYLLTERAKKNGMICGDCGTFMAGMFATCFDPSAKAKTSIKATTRFSVSSEEFKGVKGGNIPKYVAMLKFGDMIRMEKTGHYVLYTGGHPSVKFEIMEMGGGGKGDTVGKEKAKANAGTPLEASGVTTHKSAVEYFQKLGMKYITITGYGVIDQK